MKKFSISFIFLLFISTISFFNISIVYLHSRSNLSKNIDLIIPLKSSTEDISNILYKNGVIKNPKIFEFYLKLYGLKYKFKSGEYWFASKISPKQVMEILIEGKSIIHKFVAPEGMTTYEILSKLDNISILTGEVDWTIPEGYLFPSTYFYSYGDQKQKIIDLMRKNMSFVIDKYIDRIEKNSPIKSRLDLLTLASIVERETMVNDEKPHVAGVYINRLRKKMKLQADPTTIYAITLGKSKMDRMLTRVDLKINSAFNTYHIYGLPPTPICCPGEEAIKSVVFPAVTRDLYFVSRKDETGRHYFAEKFLDHKNNILKSKK